MSNKLRRTSLWKKNPNCYWCGVKTRLSTNKPARISNDLATIDHIRSRLNPSRTNGGREIVVLACHKCNRERAQIEHHGLMVVNPEAINKKCQTKPASKRTRRIIGRVANMAVRYVDSVGEESISSTKSGRKLVALVRTLKRHWEHLAEDRKCQTGQ